MTQQELRALVTECRAKAAEAGGWQVSLLDVAFDDSTGKWEVNLQSEPDGEPYYGVYTIDKDDGDTLALRGGLMALLKSLAFPPLRKLRCSTDLPETVVERLQVGQRWRLQMVDRDTKCLVFQRM